MPRRFGKGGINDGIFDDDLFHKPNVDERIFKSMW
jgi:hypothetical protein